MRNILTAVLVATVASQPYISVASGRCADTPGEYCFAYYYRYETLALSSETLTRNQPPTAGYRAVNDWRTCETAASALGYAATIATDTSVAYRPYFGYCFLYATTTTLYSNPLMTDACTLVNATPTYTVACSNTPPPPPYISVAPGRCADTPGE